MQGITETQPTLKTDGGRSWRDLVQWRRLSIPLAMIAIGMAILAQLVIGNQSLRLLSLGLFLVSGLIGLVALSGHPFQPNRPVGRSLEWPLFGLVMLVGIGFRLYLLDSAPEGVWFDEAQNGLVAQRILNDPTYRPIFIGEATQLPAGFFYLAAAAIKLLGPTILALRLVSTLAGLAAIAGVYLLGRLLFGVPVALIAALFLAVERWHVNFSRFAMSGILVPMIELLALFLCLRGLKHGHRRDLALAGLLLGLGLYTYPAFYVVPVIVALTVLIASFDGQKPLRYLATHWQGLVVMVVTMVVTALPLATFAITRPNEFFQRTDTASLFRGKSVGEGLQAFLVSLGQHVAMFNIDGDRNGRHNLPGAPLLDPIMGALLVVGLIYCLARIRRTGSGLLVIWLVLSILPASLSLDFEAPQAYRSIPGTPAVALIAALGLGWLASRAWEERRRVRGVVIALPVVGGLALTTYLNFDTYFNRQLPDFAAWSAWSIGETLVAREIQALPPETRVLLPEAYAGHPTLRFLLSQRKELVAFEPTTHLPARGDQALAVFVNPQVSQDTAAIRRVYPKARVTEHRAPGNGTTIVESVIVDSEQITALQGATESYYGGLVSEPSGQPAAQRRGRTIELATDQPLPVELPATIQWRAILIAPSYGKYRFRVEGPAGARLMLDETEVTRGGATGGELQLAKGNHTLSLVAPLTSAEPVRLLWQTPEQGSWQPVPRDLLFGEPVTNNGLLGNYFTNATWQGAPTLARIDQTVWFRWHLLPLPRPWTAEWTGMISIPADGQYTFGTHSIDWSWLWIDGTLLIDNSKERDTLVEQPVTLTAGLHEIRIRYIEQTNFTFVRAYWTPPGGQREPLPNERLFPPQGRYPVTIVPLTRPTAPVTANAAASKPSNAQGIPTAVLAGPTIGGRQLREPRGLTSDSAGNVYIIDTIGRQVVKLDGNNSVVWAIESGAGEAELIEPVAAVIDDEGRLIVLDSRQGWLHRYDRNGRHLGRFGGPALALYQPRGMARDATGQFIIADTGGARVVRLDPQGHIVGQIGTRGSGDGQLLEPVDVVVDENGGLFVADAANSRIVAFGADGVARQQWPIPKSTSVHAPHLALDGRGGLYVSAPEQNTIFHYAADGQLRGEFRPVLADNTASRRPMGLSQLNNQELLVADSGSGRILRLRLGP